MVDPTQLNELQKKDREKKPSLFGKTFGVGLLGGIIGGLVFLALKGFGSIDSFPVFILSGIGIMALYLYFIDQSERNKRQIPFLFLSGFVSTLITLFFYILLCLYKTHAGITFRNIFDAYFHNTSASAIDGTLLFHIVAFFFTAVGIGLAWLYIAISVPKWEKKHGKQEPKGIRGRKQ